MVLGARILLYPERTPAVLRHSRNKGGGETSVCGAVAIMTDRKALEAKLIEHLEAAQAITGTLGLDQTGYLVERALDDARAVHWPHIDPNVEVFRHPPRNR